uniref:Uncharacterized protein n=1 Tax=Arundo donax TaxID=35708 RepID=A0A0A9DTM4_ARUDO
MVLIIIFTLRSLFRSFFNRRTGRKSFLKVYVTNMLRRKSHILTITHINQRGSTVALSAFNFRSIHWFSTTLPLLLAFLFALPSWIMSCIHAWFGKDVD